MDHRAIDRQGKGKYLYSAFL